jgi:hypothetical protein
MFVKVSANRATPTRHVQKHLGSDHVLMMSLVPSRKYKKDKEKRVVLGCVQGAANSAGKVQ